MIPLGGSLATTISVSTLGGEKISTIFNQSALYQFNQLLNSYAQIREYLIMFTTNLSITTVNSIKLQSAALTQLTKETNQLTRTTLTLASDRCYQLTLALYSISTTTSYEDVQIAGTQLLQCASNVLTVR